MINILKELKEKYNIEGIKAEFEDEGLSLDDVLRLKNYAESANLNFALKIGGAGAISDIKNAKECGITTIIAPMIESKYALQKFVKSARSVYGDKNLNLYINIETKSGLNSIDEILNCDEIKYINGAVFGRSDMMRSLDFDNPNDERVLEIAKLISKKVKSHNKKFIVGGGISDCSLEFLCLLGAENFDYFETRKVIFNSNSIKNNDIKSGIALALEFEIMWLKSLKNPLKSELERINKLENLIKKIPTEV